MAYKDFARFYDRLMEDAGYAARTNYLLKLFDHFGKRPRLLLDLACGTGGFSVLFAARGIEVIGVDASAEMLSYARQKADAAGLDLLFLEQKVQALELYGTVDGAICCLDSLNHLTFSALCQALRRVSLFLEPGCLFLFDVNTVYKHRKILGSNAFVRQTQDVFCVWRNQCRGRAVEIQLDFFEKMPDGNYRRSSETFTEYAFTPEQLQEALTGAGLRCEAVYGDMTMQPPKANSERNIYIVRKV